MDAQGSGRPVSLRLLSCLASRSATCDRVLGGVAGFHCRGSGRCRQDGLVPGGLETPGNGCQCGSRTAHGWKTEARNAQSTALRAARGSASGKAFRTWLPEQQRAEGPDLLSARRDSPGALGNDGAEDTGRSWCRDPQEEGCPRELHFDPAPRFSEAGGPMVPAWGLRAACFSMPSPGFVGQGPGGSVGAKGVSRPCFVGVCPVLGLLRRFFNS